MEQYARFSILDSVDSTNNYAMGQIHAGLAKHGMAWFANSQTAGKGQRGKAWQSNPGENILMSIAIEPSPGMEAHRFSFNASIALACISFLQSVTGESFTIKWPNDLYWRDRKAGGILIENIIQGNQWKWCIAGIGININQERFPMNLLNPVSLTKITGRQYDPTVLARQLHTHILEKIAQLQHEPAAKVMDEYNSFLYKKDCEVQLRKNNIVFKTNLKEVDQFGNLLTVDAIERSFIFGEVEWVTG